MYRAQMVQINDVNCREKEVTVFLWRGRLLFCLLDILRSPQPSQPIKPALRQSEAEDNAEDDRARHLDRLHAVDGTLCGIIHNKMVGSVVDAGARNERENAGNQVHGHRILADGGDGT